MRFEKGTGAGFEKGIPFEVKRQFILSLLLLAIVVLLSYRLLVGLSGASAPRPKANDLSPVRLGGASRTAREGPPSGAREPASISSEVSAPRPAEPFVEKPEVLLAAAAADRSAELEDEAVAYFFQKILDPGTSFRSEAAALSLYRDDKVAGELVAHPEKYRGRLIEVNGFVVSPGAGQPPLQVRGLNFPNASGRDRAYESYLYGTDDKYYLVHTLEKRHELSHRQGVRLRAYFCQLYTNQVLYKGELVAGTIPFLVGEDYELVDTPPAAAAASDPVFWLPLLVFLPMAALAVAYLVNRRARRSFEERRQAARKRLEKRRAGAASSGSSPAPAAPSRPAGGGAFLQEKAGEATDRA